VVGALYNPKGIFLYKKIIIGHVKVVFLGFEGPL